MICAPLFSDGRRAFCCVALCLEGQSLRQTSGGVDVLATVNVRAIEALEILTLLKSV